MIQLQEDEKTRSPYKDKVRIQFVNRSPDASQEYVTLRAGNNLASEILVTGWTLKSLKTGMTATIPEGTYLIFAGSINTDDPIYLTKGDVIYIVSGTSPNGYNFKTNKCSGYMSQYQNFVPYLTSSCPAPKYDAPKFIPDNLENDTCYDYLGTMPSCRIQSSPLPLGLSGSCQNFIYNKINYSSCVDLHKDDKDFYQKEWRVYLGRSSRVWKSDREFLVLYDNDGKIVDTLSY